MPVSHEAHVVAQFGPRARAYVESDAHRQGADLDRLSAIVRERPGARVLDLGCGGGHVSFTVARFVSEVVAYDLSEEMLSAVRDTAAQRGLGSVRTQQGSAEALPFADGVFDLVFTRYSAHHWRDLPAALAEMRRVLKPGGLAVVMDAVSPGPPLLDTFLQCIEMMRDPSHVRDYAPSEFDAALRTAGFRPAPPVLSRLRLDFVAWVARIGTPDAQVVAIRTLQRQMPREVIEHFEIEPDGSFTLDTMLIEAKVGAP